MIIEAVESFLLSPLPPAHTCLFLEGYAFGQRAQRGHLDRAELVGVLKHKIIKAGFTLYLVGPTVLKSFTALHGHAEKSDMMINVQAQTGILPKDDNEADALALVLFGQAVVQRGENLDYTVIRS